MYKTTDAGKTWSYAGLRDTHMIAKIAVDPNNARIAYAASMGHVFRPNPERGIFKTTDGGNTWSKVLFVNDDTGAIDLAMDSRNPNVLYAAMWQAQRFPWKLSSGGPGSGLYKTLDGGRHWMRISSNPGFATGLLGKIGVAVAASDPRIVYAIVQAHDGGVFRRTTRAARGSASTPNGSCASAPSTIWRSRSIPPILRSSTRPKSTASTNDRRRQDVRQHRDTPRRQSHHLH